MVNFSLNNNNISLIVFECIDIHATYTRLIPKIKKRYDYGVMIFLLTFKLFFDALDTCLFFLYLLVYIIGLLGFRPNILVLHTLLCLYKGSFVY
jgi:hypothetical protein